MDLNLSKLHKIGREIVMRLALARERPEDLAIWTGLSDARLSEILYGAKPTWDELVRLAEYFDVEVTTIDPHCYNRVRVRGNITGRV